MTVSYSRLVANGSSFGCFGSILCKWRGSVYKLVWRELAAYLVVYFAINLAYRFAFTEAQQKLFIKIRCYLAGHSASVPLTFAMSFYVGLVVKRWWEQYRLLPWPDTLALFASAAIPGTTDERGRLMRRNIVRYAVLAYVITLKQVSIRVKKRFPTLQHIVDAGIMLESEKKIVEMMDERSPMSKYWMPLVWATNIINRARRESLISSDQVVQTLLVELSDIRRRLGSIISYDTVCVPLVYTQVVTLSLYAYFGAQLIGAQMVEPPPEWGFKDFKEFDLYVPILTIIEFCFFVGWLKVAEVLIGPFGEDDDDIELNWLIDRHIKAAYMIVDEMHEEHPELLKDQYWDEVVPKDLPYTVASEHYRREEPKGSAECFKVKESDSLYANMAPMHHMHRKTAVPEDVYADYESVDTPMAERRKNWFQRQIHRVGSIRSSSTTYSSGGLFNRTRHNSVYSSPENGLPVSAGINGHGHVNGINGSTPHLQKITLYDRLWGRKSMKSRRGSTQGSNKINGQMNARGRPRIPTPDVQKDGVVDKDNKQNMSINGSVPPGTYTSDLPAVVQVVLSPIQEMDPNLSGTFHNQRRVTGAVSVCQGVLNPAFAGTAVYTTMSVSPIAVSTVSMSRPLLAFRSDSFVLRVFCPLSTALAACQQPSVVFTLRFPRPQTSIFIMKIFKDIFSGDEMFSDTYKFKLVDGVLYEVYGKLITRKLGDVTLDGANPSAEEGCEGTEEAVESGVDVVLNHRLMETYAFPDKKSFTLYLKEYMKRLVDKMTENGSTEVDVFKTNINKVMKDLLTRFKELQFFTGENMDIENGMVAMLEYRDIGDDNVPVLMLFKHGLDEEKF